MSQEKTTAILKQGLLAFVLVTIGFAIGKEVTLRRMQPAQAKPVSPPGSVTKNQIVVSYAHATQRCVNCNTIERLVRETLEEQFAEAMTQQRVTFQEINFQEDTAFAQAYMISANSVIVHRIVQGRESDYQNLDRIWDLFKDPPAFKQYVGDAVRTDLDTLPGDDA